MTDARDWGLNTVMSEWCYVPDATTIGSTSAAVASTLAGAYACIEVRLELTIARDAIAAVTCMRHDDPYMIQPKRVELCPGPLPAKRLGKRYSGGDQATVRSSRAATRRPSPVSLAAVSGACSSTGSTPATTGSPSWRTFSSDSSDQSGKKRASASSCSIHASNASALLSFLMAFLIRQKGY